MLNLIRRSNLSNSKIWNQEYILNELNNTKKSTHAINKLRSQFLLPGTELSSLENHSKIPILLIQNSLNNNISALKNGNLYSGWDLIMPFSWGMSFWLTLIHHGARALGQNEVNYLLFESGNLQFPFEFLDSQSSQIENEKQTHDLFKKYISKPPSKRVNYLKSAFLSPFYFPIKSIVSAYSHDCSFFILRNKQFLNKLANQVLSKKNQKSDLLSSLNVEEKNHLSKSFVCVRLLPFGKGKIDKFSLLYENAALNKMDTNEEKSCSKLVMNKVIHSYRNRFLASLNEKPKASQNSENKSKINKLIRNKFCKENVLLNEENFQYYLHELNDSNANRRPVGFVCNSGFTLVNGKVSANGFLLTKFLLDLIEKKDSVDLSIIEYKMPSSLLYNKAKINGFHI